MQQLQTIFKQDLTYPTLNRDNKDFAAWEKQENIQKKELKIIKQQEKYRFEKENQDQYRLKMVNQTQDPRFADKVKKEFLNNDQKPYISNLNGVQIRDPITQKLLISDHLAQNFKDEPSQLNLFQGKKRNDETFSKYQSQTQENQQNMQRKKRIDNPPKSEQQNLMQGKKRNDDLMQFYFQKSQEEKPLMQGKKRNDESFNKYLHGSQDEQPLMQGKKRNDIYFMQQQSQSQQDAQLFKSKYRINNTMQQISNDHPLNNNVDENYIPKKQFQGKKRDENSCLNLMQQTNDQQNQFQGKKRVTQLIIPQQEDDLIIQKLKKIDNCNSWKQSDSLQVLMQSKKRDYVQNLPNLDKQEQQIFQGKKRVQNINQSVNINSSFFQDQQQNPYLND